MQQLIKISKALSDETRIRMLKLLCEKDICICEMQEIFTLSESQISRNLKFLMDAGFLSRRREGKTIVYSKRKDLENSFCEAIFDVLGRSFDDNKTIVKDKENLSRVIDSKLREKKSFPANR